jgi:hypothetical protein
MKDTTIGQRILAAVLSHQLGISMDRALKLYVQGREIHPSYDAVGDELLKHARLAPARLCFESARPKPNTRQSRSALNDQT